MLRLYYFFRAHPYASMEMNDLHEACDTSPQELNWNIVYLEKSGYVELSRSADCPPFVSCTATITGPGVDLVENEAVFDNRFPVSAKKEPS